jgi:mono/diheme cytochrome c family protein
MKPKLLIAATCLLVIAFSLQACNNDDSAAKPAPASQEPVAATEESNPSEIKPSDVELTTPLNQAKVTAGKGIYEMKCQSCHKLTDEKVVGPGWKGLTKRREPHWIMNMVMNTEMMLEKDPEAQKLLEQCLVRMPNQNLSQADSRNVLEFMRSNDGVK